MKKHKMQLKYTGFICMEMLYSMLVVVTFF